MPNIGVSLKPVVTVTGSTIPTITNLVVATPATEVSHVLSSSLKQLIIKSRVYTKLQIAFVSTESGTKFFTIERGATLSLDGLSFSGKTLYVQAASATTVEIFELT